MGNMVEITARTKVSEGSPERVETTLQIDKDSFSEEAWDKHAASSIRIAWQRLVREEGKIPTGTVNLTAEDFAPKPRGQRKVTRKSVLSDLQKLRDSLTPEEFTEFLREQTGGSGLFDD